MAAVVQDLDLDDEDYPECYICCGRLREPFIRCSECRPTIEVCLSCFCEGGEAGNHSNNHSYEILSNNFSILEDDWTAQEEIHLLDSIADCGIGNWAEVAKQMQTKSKEECEKHYKKCYLLEAENKVFPVLRCLTDSIYKSRPVCPIPFQVSEDPPRPAMDSFKSVELAGYMPCRGDFDVEYDNYAEFDIKDIAIDYTDSTLLRELRLAAVQVFITRLRQRWYRKKIVQRYGLINIKKLQMLERRQDKAERDIRESLRPFARLQSADEHEKLVQGIQLENFLKRKILSLQEYRMAGITTKQGALMFEKLKKRHEEDQTNRKVLDDILVHVRDQKVCQSWLQRQALLECGKGLAPIPLPSLGRKPAARLELSGTPGLELLSLEERELCSNIRVLPLDYINYKNIIIKENEKYGELRLAQARTIIRIDVNKTRKMYNFFVDKGWISKPED